ncbi:hypothetical protein EV680_1321 [Uruburuella suis]|jgi:hypothetical protein|uniref:Uncharacterized protein n=1 Tax=Uruburuella suis TaxID=252130 RepID=A0ABY2BXK5_9NEIS|nr:hypothetical protein EV680_1321 [Uruburuella suis]
MRENACVPMAHTLHRLRLLIKVLKFLSIIIKIRKI